MKARARQLRRSFGVALALLAALYLVGERLAREPWSLLVTWPLVYAAVPARC